jgi:hypothetical protein
MFSDPTDHPESPDDLFWVDEEFKTHRCQVFSQPITRPFIRFYH